MMNNGIWTEEEHDRFLYAIKEHPKGPWSVIAEIVGTRSVRQVQTHTQKYYEKIMRRMRGLQRNRKTWARLEHRIEDDILQFCKTMSGPRVAAEIASHMAGGAGGRESPAPRSSASTLRAASPTQEAEGNSEPSHYQPAGSEQQETKSSSSTPSSPPSEHLIQEIDALLDVEDDEFFELPSLEESLDFFIASLEHDTQL